VLWLLKAAVMLQVYFIASLKLARLAAFSSSMWHWHTTRNALVGPSF